MAHSATPDPTDPAHSDPTDSNAATPASAADAVASDSDSVSEETSNRHLNELMDEKFQQIVAGLDLGSAGSPGVFGPDLVPDHEDLPEEFVPPAAGGLLDGNPSTHLAWFAVISGISIFVTAAIAHLETAWKFMAVLLFVGGAGALFMQLPNERDEYDDGAEV